MREKQSVLFASRFSSGGGGGGDHTPPINVTSFSARDCEQDSDVSVTDCIKPAPSVTSLASWFANSSFTELDLRAWDTSKITTITKLFEYSSLLQSVKLGTFTNCTNFSGIFRSTPLTNLSIERVTISDGKAYAIDRMFISCTMLEEVDLSSMIGKVSKVEYMFENCPKLMKLDVSQLDFTEITSTAFVFNKTSSECLILVKDQANKDWFAQHCPTMTNVVIK